MHLVTGPDTDSPTTDGSGTHGLTLWNLARSMGLPRECPECSAGVLSSIRWHHTVPVELLFSCSHSALPVRPQGGKHRWRDEHEGL